MSKTATSHLNPNLRIIDQLKVPETETRLQVVITARLTLAPSAISITINQRAPNHTRKSDSSAMKSIYVFLFSLTIFGQQPKGTGTATTRGTCSPANTGTITTFNFTRGIGQQQGTELLRIVNKILANQPDLKTFNDKLDAILNGINQIKSNTAQRRLTADQKEALFKVVQPFPGQRVSIWCIMGDGESKALALDFVEVLRKAQWAGLEGSGVTQAMPSGVDPTGVSIHVSYTDVLNNKVPPAANPLLQALIKFGLFSRASNVDDVAQSSIQLIVGRRPSPIE